MTFDLLILCFVVGRSNSPSNDSSWQVWKYWNTTTKRYTHTEFSLFKYLFLFMYLSIHLLYFYSSLVGVLLYGPPGTGKTLLARACAAQTKVRHISHTPHTSHTSHMFCNYPGYIPQVSWTSTSSGICLVLIK